jgi:hypothetical protein
MKQPYQKSVTVRFQMRDYLDLMNEAEEKNTNAAEVIRQAWTSHQEHKNLIFFLSKLEQKILTNTFEICAATVGLSDIERKAAARQVNIALGREIIQ